MSDGYPQQDKITCPDCGAHWVTESREGGEIASPDGYGLRSDRYSTIVSGSECGCRTRKEKELAAARDAEAAASKAAVENAWSEFLALGRPATEADLSRVTTRQAGGEYGDEEYTLLQCLATAYLDAVDLNSVYSHGLRVVGDEAVAFAGDRNYVRWQLAPVGAKCPCRKCRRGQTTECVSAVTEYLQSGR